MLKNLKRSTVFFFIATIFLTGKNFAAEKPLTILALGDSTTAGTPEFRSPVEVPPHGEGNVQSQYIYWMMKAHPEWTVLNRGVNGERTDQILNRFEQPSHFFLILYTLQTLQ